MINTIDPTLDAKNAALFTLLMPHRCGDVLQRINLWVVAKTGKKLPDYIANGDTLEAKIQLIDELTEIVRKQDWSKLPKVPNGQAAASAAAVPTPPAANPVVPPPSPPADKTPQVIPTPAWTALIPAALPSPPVALAPTPTVLQGDIGQQLVALLTRLMPQPQPLPASTPPVSEDQVRRLVRTELSDVFTKIAGALAK